MNNNISDKDKKDWENFLSNKSKLPNKDSSPKTKNKFKTSSIDLHGYTLEQANKTIEDFIKKSYLKNINKLIVVTGKGLHSENEKDPYVSKDLSILKYSVPEFISNSKDLMNIIYEIKDAKIEDGGSGAFYIFLKKIKFFNLGKKNDWRKSLDINLQKKLEKSFEKEMLELSLFIKFLKYKF